MLAVLAERRRGHDVRGRVDLFPCHQRPAQHRVVPAEVVARPCWLTQSRREHPPGRRPIEDLEEQARKKTSCQAWSPRRHLGDQVLADPIRGPVAVGEPVSGEDRIIAPRRGLTGQACLIDSLPGRREPPVRIEHLGRLKLPACQRHRLGDRPPVWDAHVHDQSLASRRHVAGRLTAG